jgi:hypothetical protein
VVLVGLTGSGAPASDDARTRELVDAFIRYLHESGQKLWESDAHSLARDLVRARNSGSPAARSLALAEVRDAARSLRAHLELDRKQSGKAYTRAGDDLEFVSDASPWIGQERLSESQQANSQAQRTYYFYAGACTHMRGIIRSIERDVVGEVAAAGKGGVTWVTRISRRLVEPSVGLTVQERTQLRTRCWTDLDDLARGAHPRRSQLRYALRVLLRQQPSRWSSS